MIFKLNNKGMTAIEILICFIIVTAITVTLFDVVTSYKTKQQIESYKSSITEYKNTVTKVINDDIIKYKLATVSNTSISVNQQVYSVRLYFLKNLVTKSACPNYASNSNCQKVLTINKTTNTISYEEIVNNSKRSVNFPLLDIGESADIDTGITAKDIRFTAVTMANLLDNFVFDAAIFHHELSTYYHIRIVAPINYY